MSQPPGQTCAVMGGIMAARMRKLGAKGVLVDGRVRDLETLRGLGVPVSALFFCWFWLLGSEDLRISFTD
jgi:regulator of RNase E activity RraA